MVLRLAFLGGAGTLVTGCGPAALTSGAQLMGGVAQPVGRTGVSDADPSDPPGRGRGGHRGSGVTDSDPSDQPGFGRGGMRRSSGVSDSDPSDPPGGGRGGLRRTAVSDSDPSDAPGRGRRGW